MAQAGGGGLRLATKPGQFLGRQTAPWENAFERHKASKTGLASLMHDAHTAAAQFLENLISRLEAKRCPCIPLGLQRGAGKCHKAILGWFGQ
jgi:hypothetical protein